MDQEKKIHIKYTIHNTQESLSLTFKGAICYFRGEATFWQWFVFEKKTHFEGRLEIIMICRDKGDSHIHHHHHT